MSPPPFSTRRSWPPQCSAESLSPDLYSCNRARATQAHHPSVYGPLPDRAGRLVPWLIDGLYDFGRIAVQVFFVISGLALTLSLGRAPVRPAGFVRFAARRYIRLAFPYLAVIG